MPASRAEAGAPTRRGRGGDAFAIALRLLTRRAHSEAELRRKLARRGCPPDEIDRAVVRARGLGYVDDAAFARARAAERSRTRGPALIARELAAKGVEREVIRAAVSEVAREEVLAAAARLAARAAGAAAGRDAVAARLRRRGFTPDVIREALGPDAAPD